jgi:hypothetical protein
MSAKSKATLIAKEICLEKAHRLAELIRAVFMCEEHEMPNYKMLKHFLVKALLATEKVPNLLFDWS